MSISKLLIANRGEIAARILRTARTQGIATSVLRQVNGQPGPAHLIADEIVEIDGPTSVAAYLDIAQIVAAAQRIGVDAVHPGYGFLAENAAFVGALDAAGITFVGPTEEVIALMGDKVRACAFVEQRGFPVAPSAIEDDDPATFVERARGVGYPLLIKPSAGGGGKGMRVVHDRATTVARARAAVQDYVILGGGDQYRLPRRDPGTSALPLRRHLDRISGRRGRDADRCGRRHPWRASLAAAALSDGRLLHEVAQIPELYRRMGAWRN